MAKKLEQELADTGERMVPAYHKGDLIYAEHITRYMCAEPIVKDKVVLDIASGSGYGTQMLAQYAKKVYGVDVSEEAIEYSKANFAAKNVEYKVGDGESIPLEDNSVDVVITFETIEHIKDYNRFMDEVMRVLKPDGVAIVSTPNDKEFAEGNHFHLHEFEYDELVKLLDKRFKNIESYFQTTWKYVNVGPADLLKQEKIALPTLNLAPLDTEQSLYFYLICSNRKITEKIEPIAALGGHYSDRRIIGDQMSYLHELDVRLKMLNELQEKYNSDVSERDQQIARLESEMKNLKNSRSYKLAHKLATTKNKIARHQ